MLYNGKKWILKDRDEAITNLIDDKDVILEQKLEEWIEKGNEYPKIMSKFKRYIDKKDNNKVLNKIKDEIKLVLFNNRGMIDKKQIILVPPVMTQSMSVSAVQPDASYLEMMGMYLLQTKLSVTGKTIGCTSESVDQNKPGIETDHDAGNTRGQTTGGDPSAHRNRYFGNQALVKNTVDACSKGSHCLWTR